VRVNVLALAALNLWRRPLPQVLKETIMDPIGASSTWRWFGYENSWIVLDGSPVQSVSGGGHWGGGMFINAYDMATTATASFFRARRQAPSRISATAPTSCTSTRTTTWWRSRAGSSAARSTSS